MMIKKSWYKIAVWFSYIFNIFFWHSISFPRINPSSAFKIFNVPFSWYKYLIVLKYSWRKIFSSIKNTNLFIKTFVNSFFDIALTFSDSSFNSFLFKSVFFTKLVISLLLAKFACANLAVKVSAVKLLNSLVIIYLSWSQSVVILFSISLLLYCSQYFFD